MVHKPSIWEGQLHKKDPIHGTQIPIRRDQWARAQPDLAMRTIAIALAPCAIGGIGVGLCVSHEPYLITALVENLI